MKKIEFPEDRIEQFCSILAGVIEPAPEQGYTLDEVRTGIKILDKLDHRLTDFEDAEYAFIVKRVTQAKWKLVSRDITTFVDCIVR